WIEFESDGRWVPVGDEQHDPPEPRGGGLNSVTFDRVTTGSLRVVFEHRDRSKSGVTEVEIWED
ncbi:MAG: hypothetical protein ACKOTB_15160, partial [Planctomycetia bacterium]